MNRRRWCPGKRSAVAGVLVLSVLAVGCDPTGGAGGGTTEGSRIAAGDSCVVAGGADSVLALAAMAQFDTASPMKTDTAVLHPNGPRASITLNAGYDAKGSYPGGFVVARYRSLDSLGYRRLNLAPGGTSYAWVQQCSGQMHVFWVSDTGSVSPRTPAWAAHPHTDSTRLIRWRDTTITGEVDSLLAAQVIDSLDLRMLEVERDSADRQVASLMITRACAACVGGWCTGL